MFKLSISSKTIKPQEIAGTWVTAHGYVRQELRVDGRYDEARGFRTSAYRGTWTVTGNRIDYLDDLGFTAQAEVIDGVLHHAGMRLYRVDSGIAA
ncbi:putative ligand-binding protein with streptavidin-like fold [Luteibacter rhizovicinus]|uniref:Putative ligand-binding protein with streptavidin-like fold n=1 Tax=Luteibacter rhizovicinus TaxID=242606 RepID=A0A4R3YJI5_9GAMM|nr:putative ligand-binding protein with streptavidin-like fold [Luteibacter rhizovicinus]